MTSSFLQQSVVDARNKEIRPANGGRIERGPETKMMTTSPDLDQLWIRIWDDLARAVDDRQDPYRLPAVALVTADGDPSVRTVVLRQVESESARLHFFTDARSPKVEYLRRRPRVAWHFWDARRQTQLRLVSSVTLHKGEDPTALARWRACPLASRLAYLKPVASGEELADPGMDQLPSEVSPEASEAGQKNFVVVTGHVEHLDYYHIGPDHHLRAEWVMKDSGPAGRWIGW
jgi:hypothetical protein